MKIGKYWKSILATTGAVVVAGEAVVSDGVITGNEWVNLVIALATAVGVYLVPNTEGGEAARTRGYQGQHGDRF
ncbi:hypothetical protein HNP84_000237 [Thermocatellispora tengchongensis]|uniref:Holin n=2 Tax=Thermocatellispora tengchongensis TaxID=1073253 RepID=A0A840NUR9_9ACTN|nr:hypothetical protein [Thermocatellispora tengchongensis]MBB5130549.1 hypothetical protein [Thermocatellispora tengchongensis]